MIEGGWVEYEPLALSWGAKGLCRAGGGGLESIPGRRALLGSGGGWDVVEGGT